MHPCAHVGARLRALRESCQICFGLDPATRMWRGNETRARAVKAKPGHDARNVTLALAYKRRFPCRRVGVKAR